MYKWFFLSILLCFSLELSSQVSDGLVKKGATSSSTEAEYLKQYNKNIKKSKIDGIYIPVDLQDAFKEIIDLSPPSGINKFKNASEEVVASRLHYGLGKWMIEKWQFERGSRFSHYLKQKGITFPDDMAQFVLRTLHRHLHGSELKEKELIDGYIQMRKAQHEKRKADRKVIKTETRLIPRDK